MGRQEITLKREGPLGGCLRTRAHASAMWHHRCTRPWGAPHQLPRPLHQQPEAVHQAVGGGDGLGQAPGCDANGGQRQQHRHPLEQPAGCVRQGHSFGLRQGSRCIWHVLPCFRRLFVCECVRSFWPACGPSSARSGLGWRPGGLYQQQCHPLHLSARPTSAATCAAPPALAPPQPSLHPPPRHLLEL